MTVRRRYQKTDAATEVDLAVAAPTITQALRPASTATVAHHAQLLRQTGGDNPAARSELMQGLQSQYGNHYVQRVLDVVRKEESDGQVAPEIEESIKQAKGGGQPLDQEVRRQMESTFGAGLDHVRVHNDAQSDTLNRALSARAFTVGSDIFFRQGAYNPGASSSRELIAHETTHVVQQGNGQVRTKLAVNQPGDKYEQEADAIAKSVIQAEYTATPTVDAQGVATRQAVKDEEETAQAQPQRQPEEETEKTAQPQLQHQPDEDEESLKQQSQRQPEDGEEMAQSQLPRQLESVVADLSNPKIAELAQTMDELAALSQVTDGQRQGIKWQKLKGEELESNPRYQEKFPHDRNNIVQAVAQVRTLIQGLTTADLRVDPSTLAEIQMHYFNRLNTLTPYYTQMANLDLLYTETKVKDKKGTVTVKKQKEAWERTCNVTSMAMTLEGLGIQIKDFKGDAALMERIAEHYNINDVTQLRLPDFLQLVAIYLSFKGKSPSAEVASLGADDFAEKVSAARAAAADLVLLSGRFDEFTTLFGVKALLITNPLEKSLTRMGELHQTDKGVARTERTITDLEKKISSLEASLSSVKDKQKPGIQKGIDKKRKTLEQEQEKLKKRKAGKQTQIEQYVDSDIKGSEQEIKKLEDKIAHLEKTLNKAKTSSKPKIEAQMNSVQEQLKEKRTALEEQYAQRTDRIAGFEDELEVAAALDLYRDSALDPLRRALESGKQVIANRVSHFVRLESLNENEIIIDDPAEAGKNSPMTWEEARLQGFFRRYVILER